MPARGTGTVTFFWSTILIWGAQAIIWWVARPRNASPPLRRACIVGSVAVVDIVSIVDLVGKVDVVD